MKITLDLADDVLRAAEARAHRDNKTTDQVVSKLARRALAAERYDGVDERLREAGRGFRPFPRRGGTVTNRVIDAPRGKIAD
jgi:hypothetical protein